jgi:hypothetical protein
MPRAKKFINFIKRASLVALLIFNYLGISSAQKAPQIGDEKLFYSQTKQVNQFFRRFNNEEAVNGDRYFQGDKEFRNLSQRNKYLQILFDLKSTGIEKEVKNSFLADINSTKNPQFLNFHGGNWFAEAKAKVIFKGKEYKVTLFLRLQEEKVGSKWVLFHVNFNPYHEIISKTVEDNQHFLHPLSHEVDFLPLYKAFSFYKPIAENYADRDFKPDFLSLFLYDLKEQRIIFKGVEETSFHFFQIHKWYFHLEEKNRSGFNSGWLITKLTMLENPKDTENLLKKIYEGK